MNERGVRKWKEKQQKKERIKKTRHQADLKHCGEKCNV